VETIDQALLSFSPASLLVLNCILGLVMFGVALDLGVEDFRRAVRRPLGPAVGLLCQFLLLPALTWVLARLLNAPPSVALGMILVASCPGGNVSNFITHFGRGDTALSVTMTAISTAAAIVMTPLNLAFWGGLHPSTAAVLEDVALDPLDLLVTVLILLGIPLVVGMLVAAKVPRAAAKMRKPFKIGSLVFFGLFIAVAFSSNFDHFLAFIAMVFVPVLLQNAMALGTGWGLARAVRLKPAEARAVSIEVGIQNSGLGLVLVFTFFGGLGGMAVIAAWWGIWHIIAGLSLAWFWSRWSAAAETA